MAVAAIFACFPAPGYAQDAPSPESVTRSLVHVLDYMAADYPVAVADGAIINEAEYAEMVAFANTAGALLSDLVAIQALADDRPFRAQIDSLAILVREKASPVRVAALARTIRNDVISTTDVLRAPRSWPDLASGSDIYNRFCSQCHGTSGGGDGTIAADLDPAPTVFNSGDRIADISPFQAYNTIRLGVDGTSMVAFSTLSDEDIWDVAFFVKSMLHTSESEVAVDTLPVDLDDVAMLDDTALMDMLSGAGVTNAPGALAVLRTHMPVINGGGLFLALSALDDALAAYRSGAASEARQHALRAYLEGIEPVEPRLGARDRTFLIELESRMMDVRSAIESDADTGTVANTVERAQSSIRAAQDLLESDGNSVWLTFLLAASIILREGLEAFLIILAILSVLHAARQQRAARWIHAGWMAAVGVGIAGWFFVDLLMGLGAANREIMEGVIALLAVLVLAYVGIWMHSMTESRKWTVFIETRILQKLGTGSLIGLASIAFFAVFREAFESVLFLSALTLDQDGAHATAVVGGALSAMALILVVAPLVLRRSVKLPVQQIFLYSSMVMGILCVMLAGKGIHALQEAGVVPVTVLDISLRFDLLGVYPSLETMLAQGIVVLVLGIAVARTKLM